MPILYPQRLPIPACVPAHTSKPILRNLAKSGELHSFNLWFSWLALFIALAGLATSSCKAVASGLAVGEGLIVKSESVCLRFGRELAYLKVLSFERDPIRRPSLPATLTEGLFFTSRHEKLPLGLFSSYRLRGGENGNPKGRSSTISGGSLEFFIVGWSRNDILLLGWSRK